MYNTIKVLYIILYNRMFWFSNLIGWEQWDVIPVSLGTPFHNVVSLRLF